MYLFIYGNFPTIYHPCETSSRALVIGDIRNTPRKQNLAQVDRMFSSSRLRVSFGLQ